MKGQLVTSRDARPRLRQHKSPCADCPFARWSLKGWLGGLSVGRWLFIAHHDGRVECHTRVSKAGEAYHCAGAAIYRANVAKSVEPPNLRLPADRKKVFARPLEFAEHHSEGKIKTHAQVTELMTTEMFAVIDAAQKDVIAVTLKMKRNVNSSSKLIDDKRTHGATKTPEHDAWIQMRRRCENPKAQRYAYYGGRGIKVCRRWKSFENFLVDMGKRPSPKYSLERRDNNGNYAPSNCKWATRKEQNRNSRQTVQLRIGNETKCLSEWAEANGVPYSAVSRRLARGWSQFRAVSTPVKRKPPLNLLRGKAAVPEHEPELAIANPVLTRA